MLWHLNLCLHAWLDTVHVALRDADIQTQLVRINDRKELTTCLLSSINERAHVSVPGGHDPIKRRRHSLERLQHPQVIHVGLVGHYDAFFGGVVATFFVCLLQGDRTSL